MSQLDTLLDLLDSERTDGYGNAPIPSAVDDDVSALVTTLVGLDSAARNATLSRMTEKHGFVLLAFSERMAALAVREKQSHFVAVGLSATAIAAMLVYIKEALPIVSLLYRSAEKLGLDLRAMSVKVTSFGNTDFDEFVRHFPERSEADRSIAAMGYVEREDQNGFLYERTW